MAMGKAADRGGRSRPIQLWIAAPLLPLAVRWPGLPRCPAARPARPARFAPVDRLRGRWDRAFIWGRPPEGKEPFTVLRI